MSENETVADILEAMRNPPAVFYASAYYIRGEVRKLADRIEAAHRRERNAVIAADMLLDKERREENERLRECLRKLIDACGEVGYKDGGTAACYESEHHLYDALWRAKDALKEGGAE